MGTGAGQGDLRGCLRGALAPFVKNLPLSFKGEGDIRGEVDITSLVGA